MLKHYGLPILTGALLFMAGLQTQSFLQQRAHPTNLVWATDKTVKIPGDLRQLLKAQDDCKGYRGTDSPTGVGLWGVLQVEQQKYAKIAYGCSLSLTSYIMAVKHNNKWQLLRPVEYFSDTAQGVPKCTEVTTYNIPASIETFCTNEQGSVVKNPTPM